MYFILTCTAVIILCFLFKIILSHLKNKQKIKRIDAEINSAINKFTEYTDKSAYFNNRILILWLKKFDATYNVLLKLERQTKINKSVLTNIEIFKDLYINCQSKREQYNNEFVKEKTAENLVFFDSFESHPLSERQREAIVHDEDNNLVIAGAGTGKTTTITGKAAYLISRQNIKPEEILLLAFTKNAAEEIESRINDKIGVKLDVNTFHKFGLNIISVVENEKPSLAFGNNETSYLKSIIKSIHNELKCSPAFLAETNYYSIFYNCKIKSLFSFKTREQYVFELERKNIKLKSLQGEIVKSYEERIIADFLFINGISYKYEDDYKYNTADIVHRQYRPDFYLTDYDIYIEHFGISKNGDVAPWMKSSPGKTAKELYNESMVYKRNLHMIFNTTLIETYSYEHQEGALLTNLETKLKLSDVNFNPRTEADIADAIKKRETNEKEDPLINLLCTFLNLFKSNDFSIDEMKKKAGRLNDSKRYLSFLRIFESVYYSYQNYLFENRKIDFSDMISKATAYITENKYISPYKYILIDEFQDISYGRYKLIKSLLNQNPETKLFCVGDDWQSIFRFTGSDIFLITNFQKYFGYTKTTFLDITYRFNDKIAEFSGRFIQQNPIQLKKEIRTIKTSEDTAKEILTGNPTVVLRNIINRLNDMKGNSSINIFVLSRFNSNLEYIESKIKKEFPNNKITFMTVHKSKGLEADYVIILNLTSGTSGFPTEIQDDPILNLVLSEPDNFEYSEERRVFYVALTRAKNKVFLLSDEKRPSKFVMELDEESALNICPVCNSGILKLRHKKGDSESKFFGCSNYPACHYSKPAN